MTQGGAGALVGTEPVVVTQVRAGALVGTEPPGALSRDGGGGLLGHASRYPAWNRPDLQPGRGARNRPQPR